MIMNREQEIKLAANAAIDGLYGLEGFDRTDMCNMFASGVTWADAHPKKVDNDCKFCKQEEVVTHKSKECDLSYEGDTLYIGVDILHVGCSASGLYGFGINYCPMCGRKLKD